MKKINYRYLKSFFLITFISLAFLATLIIIHTEKEKFRATTFSFHVSGNSLTPRFGEGWYKSLNAIKGNEDYLNCLLQAIAIEPKTKNDIIAVCGMSIQWLNESIDKLKNHNCLGEDSENKIYSKIPILTKNEMKRTQERLSPIAKEVAERIKKYLPGIKKEYEKFKLDTDPIWDEVAHLVIDKLLIDGSFHSGLVKLEKARGIKEFYSSDQKKIPAWFIENYTQYGMLGCNWYSIKGNNQIRDIFYLHGSPLMRFEFPINQYKNNKDFKNALVKIGSDGNIKTLNSIEMQIFQDLGWIINGKLAVPVIDSNSIKVLIENELKKVGDETAKIVFNNFSVIIESYYQSTYSKISQGAGDYIQICYHLLFASIVNQLIKIDALPPIPQPCLQYLGVYITDGSCFHHS